VKWFYAIDKSQLNAQDYKTSIVLQLLNIDGSSTNTVYAILGAYPLNVPSLDGLNQDNNEGHVTFEANFGFDDVAHGTVSNGAITWDEIESGAYFPYADKLTNLKLLGL